MMRSSRFEKCEGSNSLKASILSICPLAVGVNSNEQFPSQSPSGRLSSSKRSVGTGPIGHAKYSSPVTGRPVSRKCVKSRKYRSLKSFVFPSFRVFFAKNLTASISFSRSWSINMCTRIAHCHSQLYNTGPLVLHQTINALEYAFMIQLATALEGAMQVSTGKRDGFISSPDRPLLAGFCLMRPALRVDSGLPR